MSLLGLLAGSSHSGIKWRGVLKDRSSDDYVRRSLNGTLWHTVGIGILGLEGSVQLMLSPPPPPPPPLAPRLVLYCFILQLYAILLELRTVLDAFLRLHFPSAASFLAASKVSAPRFVVVL